MSRLRRVDSLVGRWFSSLADDPDFGSAFRVIDWDAEQGPSLRLGVGERELLIELGPRSEREAFAKTRKFNLYARDPFMPARRLGEFERELVERVRRLLERAEKELPLAERPAASERARIREIEVDRMLIKEGRGHYYLNPYAGCLIGCPFCFVDDQADLSRALDGEPRQAWGRWLDVKVNAAEVLSREIEENPPGIVRMSPILTDPYQPIERRYRVTRRCLEVLREGGFTPAILTRAARVIEDLELLRSFPSALVGLSIPSDDDRVRRWFEPAADRIELRLDALRKLHRAGIRTFAVIQPILPMDPDKLITAVAPFVEMVRIDRLYFGERVAHVYRAHGIEPMASDAWADATRNELTRGFEQRGVRVGELDSLTA